MYQKIIIIINTLMHLPYEESHGQKIKLNKLDLINLY